MQFERAQWALRFLESGLEPMSLAETKENYVPVQVRLSLVHGKPWLILTSNANAVRANIIPWSLAHAIG